MKILSNLIVGLALFVLAGTSAKAEPAVAWQRGPSTREVENGAVLENDLNFVAGNGQAGANYYPQAAVVSWPLIPGDQPGRYRVSLRARTEKFGSSSLVLQAWVRPEDGGPTYPPAGSNPIYCYYYPLAVRPMTGSAFTVPGQWQEFALEFDVEAGKPVAVGLMYLGTDKPCSAGKVQVEKSSLRLEKLDVPVMLSWARPVKLRYKHREPGQLEVRLTNATDAPQRVSVRPVVVTDTDTRQPGKARAFTVPAKSTLAGLVPFAVPAEDGGYAAIAELLVDGKVMEQNGDVFAVTDSPFQCMLQVGIEMPDWLAWAHHLGLKGLQEKVLNHWDSYVKECTATIERMRRAYCTYQEVFSAARENATALVEDSDEPYLDGMSFYPVSRKQILLFNGLMKAHGIAPSSYVNAFPFGWPAFELFRRRPEWFQRDPVTGQPDASFDTEVMEKYLRGETVSGNVYPTIKADFHARAPIDGQTYLQYHIDQLVRSVQLYGWEAFRYDAGPLASNDFPVVKARLAALKPTVGIGNNLGIIVLGSEPSPQWSLYCRNQSLMMEEVIGFAFGNAADANRRWPDWINYLRRSSHLARSSGAHYTNINGAGNWYSTALSYAVGGHPWGCYKSPFGDYERFMLRYGFIFWDLRTAMLPTPEQVAEVVSPRPLWWKPLVSQRVLSARHRQVIFPLFNPPAEAEVIGTTMVGPVDGATVTFTPTPNETVTAWLLAPEPVAQRVALPITRVGNQVRVTIPRFWGWTNVIFDCNRT